MLMRRSLPPLNPVEMRPELYESLWLLSRRLMAANELRPLEFVHRFRGTRPNVRDSIFWHVYQRLDLKSLAPYVGHTTRSISGVLPSNFELGRPSHPLGPIKLCLDCANIGYHSVLHEVQWIDHCPIHGTALITNCPRCGRFLSHTSAKRLGQSPRTLPCGHPWTSAEIDQSPDIDASAMSILIAWLRRVHSIHSGERWFAIALGSSRALQRREEDFEGLVDLFLGITECWGSIRAFDQEACWSTDQVMALAPESIRPDWFESSLQQFKRISDRGRLDLAYRANEAIGLLSNLGRRGFVSMVQRSVCAVEIATGDSARLSLESTTAELLAAVLMNKHSRSTVTYRFDAGDAESYLKFACHLSGQPLGILRLAGGRPMLYWLAA